MAFYVRQQEAIDIFGGASGSGVSLPISANGRRSGTGTIYIKRIGLVQVFAVDLNENILGNKTTIIVLEDTDSTGESDPTISTLPNTSSTLPSTSSTWPSTSSTWPSTSSTLPITSFTLSSTSFTLPSNSFTLPSTSSTSTQENSEETGAPARPNPGSNTTKPLNPGQIAGMLIGIVTLTLLLTIGIMKFQQRHKARLERSTKQGQVASSALSIDPYPHTITPNIDREKKHERDLLNRTPPENNDPPSRPELALETERERERRIVHLEDSGWRPVPENSSASVVLLPPRYDAAV
ncbi:hypothetical protein VNI00_014212 [Paramarasmius palmivorus]|uniref:Uncharacterized protein n=1 Tax=Paramarasmius palmivorus TaxID=297713 RepID=A0AAW0BU58_9AGAR